VETGVIRNKQQALDLIECIKQMRLPFKFAFQEIFPIRSVDYNDYLWGYIYTPISAHTGHTPEEVHERCKVMFNFKYDFEFNHDTKKYDIVLCVGSTTKMDTKVIWNYALAVRAWAETEYHLCLHMPSESFIPELNFDYENNNKLKRL
jgi:hypothetical protein